MVGNLQLIVLRTGSRPAQTNGERRQDIERDIAVSCKDGARAGASRCYRAAVRIVDGDRSDRPGTPQRAPVQVGCAEVGAIAVDGGISYYNNSAKGAAGGNSSIEDNAAVTR